MYYFREILPVDAVLIMNSVIYLRNISHEYLLLLLLLTSRPPLPDLSPHVLCFFRFIRTRYSSHVISDISSSLDLSKKKKKKCRIRNSISGIGNYLD